jgi:acyl-CoA dehydrogenase
MSVLGVEDPAFMQDEEISLFRNAVGKFFEDKVTPERITKWRTDGQVEPAFWREAGEMGLLGVSVPEEYGGHAGDLRHDLVVIEQVQKHRVEGFAASLHNMVVTPYVQAHGTEEQKKKWLPGLVTGERISAIAMSEPGAGSDLQAIRTTAIKDGNGYRINGSKVWISNGQISNFIIVVAKTDPSQGAKGTSLIIVEPDKVEGFRRGKNLDKIGLTAQDTSELFFDDVWVPEENLLGGVEGRGFIQLMAELPKERLVIAYSGVVTMEAALATTIEYTKERKVFGKTLIEFQNTQFKLADVKARATVAKVFLNHCIEQLLAGKLDLTTAAIAKLWITENEFDIVNECLQLHGGYGYVNDYPIAQMFKNSRVQTIYGGSSEIMKLLIARSL